MNRLLLPLLLLFWSVMMFLLWRSEYGGSEQFGSPIAAATVWQRVLTAPDDSALEIRHGRDRVGRVLWAPNVGQELAAGKVDELAAEGRVARATHYSIDLDGHLQLEPGARAHRFTSQLRLATNLTWEAFSVRLSQRPHRWSLTADATNRTVELTARLDGEEWTHTVSFDDLRHPGRLLAQMGAPWAAGLLAAALPGGLLPGGEFSPERLAAGIQTDARQDWFELGHTRLRAYRLTLRLSESLRVQLLVSRAGEILRADLPDRWTLLNEKFLGY